MIHTKDNCTRSDQILANRCGLACANCGACKCGKEKLSDKAKEIIKPEWDKMQEFINEHK